MRAARRPQDAPSLRGPAAATGLTTMAQEGLGAGEPSADSALHHAGRAGPNELQLALAGGPGEELRAGHVGAVGRLAGVVAARALGAVAVVHRDIRHSAPPKVSRDTDLEAMATRALARWVKAQEAPQAGGWRHDVAAVQLNSSATKSTQGFESSLDRRMAQVAPEWRRDWR